MIYRLLLAALCVVCFSVSAEARQRYAAASDQCNLSGPNAMTCEGVVPHPRGERIVKAMGGFGTARKVYKQHVANVDWRAGVRQNKVKRGKVVRTETASFGAPTPSVAYTVGRPMRYIAGRLVCAVNVNAALAERGIKGTGSALAKSFLSWGRSAGGPVPGAVIVSHRSGGGHVAIVSRVENGVVYAWNATGGQTGWREIPYRKNVIDYRVPG